MTGLWYVMALGFEKEVDIGCEALWLEAATSICEKDKSPSVSSSPWPTLVACALHGFRRLASLG